MDYRQIVRERATSLGLDPNLAEALVHQESGGNPNAVSPAGAVGLMQLMPGTAKELGVDPRIPEQNIDGGLRYLKKQIEQYGVAGGLAAYNAGPGRVQRAGLTYDNLPEETRKYVPAIMNRAALIAEQKGAAMSEPAPSSGPSLDLPTLMGGLEKARAANDTEAVSEISGAIQGKFKAALSKAQAAGDTEAVQEIQGSLAALGAPQATTPAPRGSQAPAAAPKALPEAPKDAPKGVMRQVDDFVRGAADTLTFGYADEIAAKLDSLVGGGQSGKTNYEEALKSQRGRDKEGGYERLAGQLAGGLAPAGIAIQASKGATKLARAGAGAATGAIQGGLYGTGTAEGDLESRLAEGAKGAAIGGAVGGALSAVLPVTRTQQGNRLIRDAGNEGAARLDAEIIQDIASVAKNPNQRGNPITAVQLNAVESRYIKDVEQLLGDLPKEISKPVRGALQNRRALNPEEISGLRAIGPAGEAAAVAIEKAQRARSMTQAMQSSGGLMPLLREGVDFLPLPAAAHRGLKAFLGGRQTREVAAQKVLSKADAADDVLARLGPSGHGEALRKLQEVAGQSQVSKDAAKMASAAAKKQAAMEKARESLNTRNEVLQGIRSPLGGGFQELLPGGRSGLNLSTDEAVKGLRLVSRQLKDNPVGSAAKDILQSSNVADESAFYGVQRSLTKLREKGILGSPTEAASKAAPKAGSVSDRVHKLDEAEVVRLLGRSTDTLGNSIKSQRGYLVKRALRAKETASKNGKLPEEDIALLKALGYE